MSEDTDLLVLCLAFKSFIPSSMFIKCSSQTRVKYLDVSRIVERIGASTCRSLPGFHAFTGCDTVSAFQGRGKVLVFRIMAQDQGFQEVFQGLGREWQLSNELYRDLQRLTCAMYCKNAGTNEVNELRYRLFCLKKGNVDSNQLPPCDDSLRKHALRANYQAAIWKRSLRRCPEIPSPLGCGWCTEDGRLAIDWMGGLPAPKAVLELLSCQCSRSFKLPSCFCMANGLKCTDLCRLRDCNNRCDDDDVVPDDEDDDDHDDENCDSR